MTELRLGDLACGDRIIVRTRSSEYRIEVIEPEDRVVSIFGGALREPRRVHLIGRLAPVRFEEASIVVGSSLAYTYMQQTGLYRTETSEVTGIELHSGPDCCGHRD